jgi:hypothetical protein
VSEIDAPAPAETAREAVDREYPFDPALLMRELRGIEKLRAEPDRELAATMYPTLKRVHDRYKPREYTMHRPPVPPPLPAESRHWLDEEE